MSLAVYLGFIHEIRKNLVLLDDSLLEQLVDQDLEVADIGFAFDDFLQLIDFKSIWSLHEHVLLALELLVYNLKG